MGEREELARQFARTLSHEHRTWDTQYVGAGDAPRPQGWTPAAPAQAAPPAQTPAETPAVARAAPAAAPPSSTPVGKPGPRPTVGVDGRKALRNQAQAWTPATKLEYLRRKNVGDCTRCPLSRSRTNIVFGVGSPQARLMFVGEAPGADEDRQGEPFVGRAGQRLTQWIEQLGMKRSDVYIANVLKCRPPGNRDPRPDEVAKCSPFLQAQIRAITPAAIVALGRHAGQLLSRRDDMTLRSMRATKMTYDAGKDGDGNPIRIPLLVTYHPAWVLRQEGGARGPDPDEMVLGDLKKAIAIAYPNGRS